MGGCGATYESRYWGRDLKIVCVEKANIERTGAVAQGPLCGQLLYGHALERKINPKTMINSFDDEGT